MSLLVHEMGHAIGLGHSEVHSSTMFYSLARGQRTLHSDDIAGTNALYARLSSDTGSIRGRVAGSNLRIGVFGAHIQAVSSLTGEVVASAITEEDGSFIISNLKRNDTYYLYTGPVKNKLSLSKFYKDIRSDFCSGQKSYRGSFFQACGGGRRGHPQGISLESDRDVGVISIQCGLDVPVDYLSNKDGLYYNDIILDENQGGDAFVGFFSDENISDGLDDKLRIDLSAIDVNSNNLYLDIKLTSQDFYSNIKWDMEIRNPTGVVGNYSNSVNQDGNPNLDIIARLPLDPLIRDNNVFEITIIPTNFNIFISNESFFSEEYFPSNYLFRDKLKFYLLIANISERVGSEYQIYSHYNYGTLSDNWSCMDGERTFPVRSLSAIQGYFDKNEQELSGAATCASISIDDDNGPDGSGRMVPSLIFGFLLISLSFQFFILVSKTQRKLGILE